MLVEPTPGVSWGVGFIQAKGKSLSLVYRWLCCHPLDVDYWGTSRAICSGGWRKREILPRGSILNNLPCVPFCLEGEKTWTLMARRFGKSPVGDSLALGSRICLVRGLAKVHDSPQKGVHGELFCGCHSASSPAMLVLVQCFVNKVGVRAAGSVCIQQQSFPLRRLACPLAKISKQCPILDISYGNICQMRCGGMIHCLDLFWPSSTNCGVSTWTTRICIAFWKQQQNSVNAVNCLSGRSYLLPWWLLFQRTIHKALKALWRIHGVGVGALQCRSLGLLHWVHFD